MGVVGECQTVALLHPAYCFTGLRCIAVLFDKVRGIYIAYFFSCRGIPIKAKSFRTHFNIKTVIVSIFGLGDDVFPIRDILLLRRISTHPRFYCGYKVQHCHFAVDHYCISHHPTHAVVIYIG